MRSTGAKRIRYAGAASIIVVSSAFLAGCQGSGTPIEQLADIATVVKFDSKTYGVPASPRVTTSRNVRKGGGREIVGKPYKVKGKWYYPKERKPGFARSGVASWYGPNFHGRLTANGEVYDMHGLSAAHKTFPLPSYAMVTNLNNGAQVMVRVNDRGPFADDRIIDVSSEAADLLDFKGAGTANVKVEYVGRAPLEGDDTKMLMANYRPADGDAGGTPDSVMVAMNEARQPAAAGISTATAFAGDLPGVRPADAVTEDRGAGGSDGAKPLFSLFRSSFAADGAEMRSGAAAALSEAVSARSAAGVRNADGAGASERINIGVLDGETLKRVEAVARGQGELHEEAVPDSAGVSVSLAVADGQDSDAILQRLWQVGAEDAFVLHD
ncbi:septal ring lytic transglycosylase RlpA family protein [Aurantimonas sp. VKM B-3413]|uniref:septal ring lytic transglycosylase RlpA family protein n=1 Tax=Aurantimonas sp. VKM B-3413 TaxID=2779401 RepID=UPI00351D9453